MPSSPTVETLSAPGCADAGNIIAEDAHAPANVTALRIQNMGDPGTPEWLGEIANVVTWDAGSLTGLHVPPSAQRGYRNDPPPIASNAFQLQCDSAGFLINTWTFSHAVPLIGQGPDASVTRDFVPPLPAFPDSQSTLILEARVSVPWVANQAPPIGDGTAQVGFVYYVVDRKSNTSIAHVIGIFENRPAGIGGSGIESLGNDGVVAFAASPLLATDASGKPVRFVAVPPLAPQMRFAQTWSEPTLFRAEISYAQFRDMLAALRAGGSASLSPDPLDYSITLFGIGGEVIPGTGNEHNVVLGASVSDMALRRSR